MFKMKKLFSSTIATRQKAGDDYKPFENRKVPHPTSDLGALMHLLKGTLGIGVMAMPLAYKATGLFLGLIATLCVGLICTYCEHVLVKCSQILCVRHHVPSMSYPDIAEYCCLSGSETMKKFSKKLRYIVNAFLLLDLLGICCVYIVFIAKNLKQIVDHNLHVDMPVQLYMLFVMGPLLLLCLIRNLKFLAPFSMVANILLFFSLIIIAYYALQDLPPLSSVPKVKMDITVWPEYFGTVIFSLEGIGVLMALENDMKNPEHFIGCPSVLNIGMGSLTVLYASVGFIGYWKYGDDICGSISLNIPTEETLAQFIKLFTAIAIFFSFALQFYVPINIAWGSLSTKLSDELQGIGELCLRIGLVFILTFIAIVFANIGPFITLIGALCLSTLGLVFPPLFELIIYREDPGWGRFNWRLIKNILLMLFGLLGCVTGVICAISEFIAVFGESMSNSCT